MPHLLSLSNFSPPLTLRFALIQAGVRLPFSPYCIEREVSFVSQQSIEGEGDGEKGTENWGMALGIPHQIPASLGGTSK